MNRVITISREFGSGGRTVGMQVAERLGIPCYDQELIEKIEEKSGLAKDFIAGGGSTGLSGLTAELELMRRLTVMVSMDSANMHLASLVGTRVVSVWGATHPYAGFLGWGQKETDCVQVERPCRPCSVYGNKPCRYGDYPCLTAIRPEEIVERIFNTSPNH